MAGASHNVTGTGKLPSQTENFSLTELIPWIDGLLVSEKLASIICWPLIRSTNQLYAVSPATSLLLWFMPLPCFKPTSAKAELTEKASRKPRMPHTMSASAVEQKLAPPTSVVQTSPIWDRGVF
jgi:hypothetical protein